MDEGDAPGRLGLQSLTVPELVRHVVRAVNHDPYSGRLPSAQELRAYETVIPGAAERLLCMAEAQAASRQRRENRGLLFDFIYTLGGLLCGFVLAIGLIVFAYLSSQTGHDAVALGFLAASTVGMVTPFIRGRAGVKRRG